MTTILDKILLEKKNQVEVNVEREPSREKKYSETSFVI